MTDTPDRIIYGKITGTDQLHPFTISYATTPAQAEQWRTLVYLAQPHTVEPQQAPLGVFVGPDGDYLLAHIHTYTDAPASALSQEIIRLPQRLVSLAAGNLELLLELTQSTTSPIITRWTPQQREQFFARLLNGYAQGNITYALQLLAAMLDSQRLLIAGHIENTAARLALVQGLIALLPTAARPAVTFSTSVREPTPPSVLITFANRPIDEQRWLAQSGDTTLFPRIDIQQIPYTAQLLAMWESSPSISAFMDTLAELDTLADFFLKDADLSAGLNALAEQFYRNQQVIQGNTIPPEALKATLTNGLTLPTTLHQQYLIQLLHHALNTRDPEAALLVTQAMDADSALDEMLSKQLIAALQTQPDSVYALIRTHLHDTQIADSRWTERLQSAALVALQVAINDADSETMINWLRLIAREPASYGLTQILNEGILAAQRRAGEDSELARHLIVLALKHAPQTVDTLLADPQFLAVLPDNVGLVMRDHTGDPIQSLNKRGIEFFLVATARAATAQAADFFSAEVLSQLWKIFTSGASIPLPDHYQPQPIVNTLITHGPAWLKEDALLYLATLQLIDQQDTLFHTFAANLAANHQLDALLTAALHGSQRSINDIAQLLNHITNAGYLPPQSMHDAYVELLDYQAWAVDSMPLIEQFARYLQQNPTLRTEPNTLWHLMDAAASGRADTVARTAMQKMFGELQKIPSDAPSDDQLVEYLLLLQEKLQWTAPGRQYLLRWWRGFVQQQSVVRLTRLSKLFEGYKSLAQIQDITYTTLAFRRMLGKRTLGEFADAINQIYSILEDLAEAFDPSPRQPNSFDEETIRAELDARRTDLSDHEWHILGKNFRELATLIGTMGDHRSKASLVRQNIDRQLLTGEQEPESAVDMLKWMAGYLEGAQDRDEETHE